MKIRSLAFGMADFFADRAGLLSRPLAAERLLAAASRRTGFADFGAEEIAEPLQRLLDACAAEASLSAVGWLALRWDALRFLTNRLRLEAAGRSEPAIAREEVAAPIVITGLPRSGTTFLHQLMVCDPANRAPLVWETIFPFPDGAVNGAPERRAARVERQLRMFGRLAPEFRDLHPLGATSPQECTEVLAHTFRSLRFDTTYRIPSYRTWLEADAEGHRPAYRLQKRFLQYLQYRPGVTGQRPQWVLKCPDHVFALAALQEVYPDARVVFVHRDPLKVLLSVAKLTEVLRRAFSRRVDAQAIGRGESARWLEGALRMVAESQGGSGWQEPICHVHYLDLIADPVATVAGVYRHFGLALPEAAAEAIATALEAEPNGGYGLRHYRFEEHGLDPEEERAKFRPYMRHFGVASEPIGEPRAAGARRPRGEAAASAVPG